MCPLQMVQAPSTARMAYIVDPRKEHNPAAPAAQPDPPTKGAPKVGKAAAAAAAAGPPADLVGAFQQGVLQHWGKEWTGVAGSGQSCAGVALHALGRCVYVALVEPVGVYMPAGQAEGCKAARRALSLRPQLHRCLSRLGGWLCCMCPRQGTPAGTCWHLRVPRAGDAELQQVLTAAPGLLYCGMGAFLNYVSAEAVATADLRQSSLALLLGHAHTKVSLRRQAYLESRSAHAAHSCCPGTAPGTHHLCLHAHLNWGVWMHALIAACFNVAALLNAVKTWRAGS